VAVAVLLLTACSSGDYSGDPAPPAPPAPTTTLAEVTVRGVVASVAASARVVTLAPPVGGVTNVALTADTEILRANGTRAAAGDIATGATIEATGAPGTPGTLVARRVVLV
jgi:hypothetical protein